MGRSLGYFDSDELDRPELNKCPDCECFFATDECPLCGKICPEEMRAGNRAKVKPPKKKRNSSGRVQFIPVYHTWWFILLAFLFSRLAGIILFLTSPYSRKAKIAVTAVAVAGSIVLYSGLGYWLMDQLLDQPLVNDKISRAEYVELCESMSVEDYHREAYNEGSYVCLELVVEFKTEVDGYVLYLCTDRTHEDQDLKILVMDCSVDKKTNYLHGDMIRVYGECSGIAQLGDGYIDGLQAYADDPLLYMAYSELIG